MASDEPATCQAPHGRQNTSILVISDPEELVDTTFKKEREIWTHIH